MNPGRRLTVLAAIVLMAMIVCQPVSAAGTAIGP